MKIEHVKEVVRDGLRKLIISEWDLAELDVSERAVTSHLFRYMHDSPYLPPELSVDHEYNRQGRNYDPKRIPTDDSPLDVDGERRILPDIIVHERGHDSNNIAVVEVKRNGECSDNDEDKVKKLTSPPHSYSFGALLTLGMRPRSDTAWHPRWKWHALDAATVNYVPVFDQRDLSVLNNLGRMRAGHRRRSMHAMNADSVTNVR